MNVRKLRSGPYIKPDGIKFFFERRMTSITLRLIFVNHDGKPVEQLAPVCNSFFLGRFLLLDELVVQRAQKAHPEREVA